MYAAGVWAAGGGEEAHLSFHCIFCHFSISSQPKPQCLHVAWCDVCGGPWCLPLWRCRMSTKQINWKQAASSARKKKPQPVMLHCWAVAGDGVCVGMVNKAVCKLQRLWPESVCTSWWYKPMRHFALVVNQPFCFRERAKFRFRLYCQLKKTELKLPQLWQVRLSSSLVRLTWAAWHPAMDTMTYSTQLMEPFIT